MNSILPLKLENVVVSMRGKRLIGPVTSEIAATGLTIVIGPNGSGKTTFLRMMHGVQRVSSGQLNWAQPIEIAQKHQAFVFQSPIMLRRNVEQNLTYPLELANVSKEEAKERAAK